MMMIIQNYFWKASSGDSQHKLYTNTSTSRGNNIPFREMQNDERRNDQLNRDQAVSERKYPPPHTHTHNCIAYLSLDRMILGKVMRIRKYSRLPFDKYTRKKVTLVKPYDNSGP